MHFFVACTKHHIHTIKFYTACGDQLLTIRAVDPDQFRRSHQRCSVKKVALKIFAKFTGKHLCQRIFFKKVAGLRPATLSKKSLWYMCFSVSFWKFLRTPFLQNTSERLLLSVLRVTRTLLTELKLNIQVNESKKGQFNQNFDLIIITATTFLLNISNTDILFVISPVSLYV